MPAPLSHDRVSIVLIRSHNPLNIGAAARAMVNFGFADLRLVEPYEKSWLGARSAVGATSVLTSAREYPTLADAVADCSLVLGTASVSRRHPHHPILALPDLGSYLNTQIPAQLASSRLALVFGSEQSGLNNDDLTHCTALLHIPTQPVQDSMNLGQAVAVCLYELARHTGPSAPQLPSIPTPAPATSEDRERITQRLLHILRQSSYIKPGADQSTLYLIREMLHRIHLSADDSHLILGMLARIRHHLTRRNLRS